MAQFTVEFVPWTLNILFIALYSIYSIPYEKFKISFFITDIWYTYQMGYFENRTNYSQFRVHIDSFEWMMDLTLSCTSNEMSFVSFHRINSIKDLIFISILLLLFCAKQIVGWFHFINEAFELELNFIFFSISFLSFVQNVIMWNWRARIKTTKIKFNDIINAQSEKFQ